MCVHHPSKQATAFCTLETIPLCKACDVSVVHSGHHHVSIKQAATVCCSYELAR